MKGFFRWLEKNTYKMHVRVLLSRYRSYTVCPDCQGKRFQPESLLYKLNGFTLADFRACAQVAGLKRARDEEILAEVIGAVENWRRYANEVHY